MVSEFCPRKGGDGGDSFSYHCSSEHPACISSDILTSPSYCAILMSLLQGNSQAKVLSAYYVLQTVPVSCTFFFFWLRCIFVLTHGLSLVAAGGLRSAVASPVVEHRL